MRLLVLATMIAAMPAAAMAQSTVGDVPSNPNAMPAVNGSGAAPVADGTASRNTMSSGTRTRTSTTAAKKTRKAPKARPAKTATGAR